MGHADAGGYFYSLVAVRMTATTVFVVHTVLSLCILVNLMTCVWWWIATLEGLDHSWVALMSEWVVHPLGPHAAWPATPSLQTLHASQLMFSFLLMTPIRR